MHTKHIISLIFFALTLVCASCSKLSNNGDIDGRWQLIHTYIKTDTEPDHYGMSEDKTAQQIYWSFQLDLLSITSSDNLNGHTPETVARFVYAPPQLAITKTYIHYRDRDSLITDPLSTSLTPLGIRGNATNYRIARLNKTTLILCSEQDSLVFYKAH